MAIKLAKMESTYLEALIASLLPAGALLLIGVIGTRLIIPAHVGLFIVVILLCVAITFVGELVLAFTLRPATKGRLNDLIAVCRDYMEGKQERRASLKGDLELLTLAAALNALLDSLTVQERKRSLPQEASVQAEEPLRSDLQRLALNILPVLNADLRVRAESAAGDLGSIADICNFLIGEFIDHIRWVRHATDQIIDTTRDVFDRSVELAQTTETQMLHFSQMTETVEKLVAYIQRLCSTLQVSVDLTQEAKSFLEQEGYLFEGQSFLVSPGAESIPPTPSSSEGFARIETGMRRQVQLLEETLQAAEKHTTLAEAMIVDLYTFAQRLHHSSVGVLRAVERIGSLATQAEQWRDSNSHFQLPGEVS